MCRTQLESIYWQLEQLAFAHNNLLRQMDGKEVEKSSAGFAPQYDGATEHVIEYGC